MSIKLNNTTIFEANTNYIETLEYGILAGPSAIIAENANHPGWFQVFESIEECINFCEEANIEGDAWIQINHHPELWDRIWFEINQLKAKEAEQQSLLAELEAGEDENYYFKLECQLSGIRTRN